MTDTAGIVDRGDPEAVAEHLSAHLRDVLGGRGTLAEPLERAKGGMEAYVYFFRLEGRGSRGVGVRPWRCASLGTPTTTMPWTRRSG